MSKKIVWFGTGRLWWCENCNLPLASDGCSICNSKGTKVEITPQFDPRPAFGWDISTMNSACLEQFGCRLLDPGTPVVMNRLPSPDRAEEAVAYGRIIARVFFDGGTVRLKPTAEGAALLLLKKQKKGLVKIADATAPFLKDGDLLAPGVEDADPGIAREDRVTIESENFVAVGIAKMSGQEMIESEKGRAVKVKGIVVAKKTENPLKTYPDDWRSHAVVAANSGHLSKMESEALSFIRREAKAAQNVPKVVSFSGGKDSLAVLLLAEKALGADGFRTIFIDTGLEFPETLEYVDGLSRDILKEGAGDSFWKNLRSMGPPARNRRWCCKVCKLGPVSRLINREFPEGCLSFMGERRYESLDRARRPRVDVNPWIEKQVHAYPIIDWTALDVWLYIFSRGAKYNPLYEKGFTRIGCWLCPACDPYDFSLVERLHPGLWGKWKLHCSPDSATQEKAKACSGV